MTTARLTQGLFKTIFRLASGLDVTNYNNEITILYNGADVVLVSFIEKCSFHSYKFIKVLE